MMMRDSWFSFLHLYRMHVAAMQGVVVGTLLEMHDGENYLAGLSRHERAAAFWWVVSQLGTQH